MWNFKCCCWCIRGQSARRSATLIAAVIQELWLPVPFSGVTLTNCATGIFILCMLFLVCCLDSELFKNTRQPELSDPVPGHPPAFCLSNQFWPESFPAVELLGSARRLFPVQPTTSGIWLCPCSVSSWSAH